MPKIAGAEMNRSRASRTTFHVILTLSLFLFLNAAQCPKHASLDRRNALLKRCYRLSFAVLTGLPASGTPFGDEVKGKAANTAPPPSFSNS